MTVQASLIFTQGLNVGLAGFNSIGTTGTSVVLSNGNDTGVVSHTYVLISVPRGSSLTPGVLGTGATATMSAPDVAGNYRCQVYVTDAGGNFSSDVREFIVEGLQPTTNGGVGFSSAGIIGTIIVSDGYHWTEASYAPINVKAYGAKGDGITNDVAAFQAAIAAKDAQGGGIVFVPRGRYILNNFIDLGTHWCLLAGEGSKKISTAPFAGAWSTNVEGSVLLFTAVTNGVTASTSLGQYTVRDLAVVGPGSGTTVGIFANTGSLAAGNFLSLENVSVYNWGVGINPGAIEDAHIREVDVCGCATGILVDGGLSGTGPNNLTWSSINVQECTDAVIFSSTNQVHWVGGLVQANTRGITFKSLSASPLRTIREIHLAGVWFEDEGYPSTPNSGPDLIFDSTVASIAIMSFNNCRFGSDSTPFQILGTNGVGYVSFYDCLIGNPITLPATVGNWNFVNCNNSSITDNSPYTTFINTRAGGELAGVYVKTHSGTGTGLIATSSVSGNDVPLVQLNSTDEAIFGDSTHTADVQIRAKANTFTALQFGGLGRYGWIDTFGTANTQNSVVNKRTYLLRTAPSAGATNMALNYIPPVGHSTSILVNWIAKDVVDGYSYSGITIGTVTNPSGSMTTSGTTTFGGNGDSALSTSTVIVAGTGGAILQVTPPTSYPDNIDWQFDVQFNEN